MSFENKQFRDQIIKRRVNKILEDIEVLEKEIEDAIYYRNQEYDEIRRKKINDIIDKKYDEILKLIAEKEVLEMESDKKNHPKKLFQCFTEFNFINQRIEFVNYIEEAKKDKIGAFVIHSEGQYSKLDEQFWLWQCVMPTYLEKPHALKKFFAPYIPNIRVLFHDFKRRLINEDFTYDGPVDDIIQKSEIDSLLPHLIKKLELEDVIISIYWDENKFINQELIIDFIEQIWQPVCKAIAEIQDRKHWLKLIIIDNEVENSSGHDYFVLDIKDSIVSRRPYKLPKCTLCASDFSSWVSTGKIKSDNFFYLYRELLNDFFLLVNDKESCQTYFPKSRTVEGLLGQICTDIPTTIINSALIDIANEHQKIKL